MRKALGVVLTCGTLVASAVLIPVGAASALPDRYVAGETYSNAMPGPAVGPSDSEWVIPVAFGSLDSVRRQLIRQQYVLGLRITSREVLVGRLGASGTCLRPQPASPAGLWTWESAPRDWLRSMEWSATGRGSISINEGAGLAEGDRPCVLQSISWRARGFSGVTFESRATPTRAGLPRPLSDQLNDLNGDPIPGVEDIVLPDLDLPGSTGNGTIPSFVDNRAALEELLERIARSEDPVSIPNRGSLPVGNDVAPGVGNWVIVEETPAQAATRESAQNATRAEAQAALVTAEASLSAASGAAASSPEYAALMQTVQELTAVLAALQAQVPIAGGPVPQQDLSLVTGVSLSLSPVTGLKGRASLGASRMAVKATKIAKRGKTVPVRVALTPRSATGKVTVSVVRKTANGIYVAAKASAPLKRGGSALTLRLPRTTPAGTYSVLTSYQPARAGSSGVSALKPITIR